MNSITRRMGFAGIALIALTALTVQAQDYPNKPIKIIAPFPVGTGPDANTREIALELTKVLGQTVVVENRPGAANMIGMEVGAKAPPMAIRWSWAPPLLCQWFHTFTARCHTRRVISYLSAWWAC